MKKMLKKSKGFTLVELLIVIIIIGILAGMMMLATGSATDKAEATKIVSNLRNMKAAAIMVYADDNKWPSDIKSLDKYMDASISSDYSVGKYGNATVAVKYKKGTNAGVNDKLDALATGDNAVLSKDTSYIWMNVVNSADK